MNQDPRYTRSSAPYTGPRRPPQSPVSGQGNMQTRRPPATGQQMRPQSAGGQIQPPRNPTGQTRRPPQNPYPTRPDSRPWNPPQTINRPPRPYGETQPLRVQMQVQCCAPTRGRIRRTKPRWPKILVLVLVLLLIMGGIALGVAMHRRGEEARDLAAGVRNDAPDTQGPSRQTRPPVTTTAPPETEPPGPAAVMAISNAATRPAGSKVESTNAIVIDVADGTVVAERLPDQRIFPASMTKVMTLIVAYEELAAFDTTFTFTADLINPLVAANASRAGFMAGETVPIIDLFYAAALPSGADATTALAELVAGSEAAFAERMNQKAEDMGLRGTHFTNASGLHDDAHYSTVREIAAIFAYAMQIEPLREIMAAYQYTTAATKQNPEGLLLTSTLFAYLSGNELPGMRIKAGKTGYTHEAKRCLVSMGVRDDGREFIAVVVGGENKWIPITDSVELYAMCLEPVPVAADGTVASSGE